MKKPDIIQCRELARTRLFRVEELQLKFSNGVERTYERLGRFEHGQRAVMIVALVDKNRFLMIREYAAGTGDYQLSLPKGLVEAGETLMEGANRELKEETGYGARQWHELTSFTLSPNYMCNSIHVVVARGLYEERLAGDEPEPLTVEEHGLDQLMALNERADFSEGRVLAALYLVRDQLQHGVLFQD